MDQRTVPELCLKHLLKVQLSSNLDRSGRVSDVGTLEQRLLYANRYFLTFKRRKTRAIDGPDDSLVIEEGEKENAACCSIGHQTRAHKLFLEFDQG